MDILFAGVLTTPLGKLLLGLIVLAAVVLVGRIVLSIAWKLLLVAIVVVGAVYAAGILI